MKSAIRNKIFLTSNKLSPYYKNLHKSQYKSTIDIETFVEEIRKNNVSK